MKITVRQLKQLIKEQVEEARLGAGHKAKLRDAIKEFLSVEFANAGIEPVGGSHEEIQIVKKVGDMAENIWLNNMQADDKS